MFVKLDALIARARSTRRDDSGATLVMVVALMSVGFIVSALIAAACLFTVQQTTNGRANIQAFSAAEGGRDAVVAQLSDTSDLATPCTNPTFTGTDPDYTVTVYATSDTAMPESAAGMSAVCPTNDTEWVVLRSQSNAGGGTVTIDSVYQWVSYRQKVSGGGLGFQDRSYAVQGVNYSGDIIVRDGDFTCNLGSHIDGSVYVLNGNFNVPYSAWSILLGEGCEVTGDVVVNRRTASDNSRGNVWIDHGCLIFFGCGGRLDVGGQVRSSGNITIDGKLYVGTSNPASDPAPPAPPRRRDMQVAGTITTTGSNARLQTSNGGSISAVGAITNNGGVISSDGSIASEDGIHANSGSITARINVVSSGAISGGNSVTATTGMIASDTSISGNGARTAGSQISAGQDLSGSGTKSAGTIVVGRDLTSTGSVTATSGDIEVGRDISGNATRSAANGRIAVGGSFTAPGQVTARTGVLVTDDFASTNTVTISDGSLTARGDLSMTKACTISENVRAGGNVAFAQRGNSSLTCRITGEITANGSSGTSTLPLHTGSNQSRVYSGGPVQARNGWNPSGGQYRKLPGNAATAPTSGGTGLTTPAAPSIAAPVDVPATTFQISDPDIDTFVSIDELYLRTGWIDLGTYTNWQGYTKLAPLSGGQCGFSYVRSILESGTDPVVIDATNCTGTMNLASWSSVTLHRDAVILLNNVNVSFVPFAQVGATAENPRQLFIVQVDNDVTERVGDSGGDPAPQPDCSPGSNKISLTFAGWGPFSRWDDNVRVMLYSPCGVANGGGSFYTWQGHVYVANDSATKDVLSSVLCRRMTVENTIDLPCSVNDFGEWGGSHTEKRTKLGDRFRQTEP